MVSLKRLDDVLFPSRDHFFHPFKEFFDKVYDEMLSDRTNLGEFVKNRGGYPKLDIYVNKTIKCGDKDRWIIQMACPGVRVEDIDVKIVPDTRSGTYFVKVTGKMNKQYINDENSTYYIKQLSRSNFEQMIRLPDSVKGDPKAIMQDGILTLSWNLPDSEKQEVRNVQVKKQQDDCFSCGYNDGYEPYNDAPKKAQDKMQKPGKRHFSDFSEEEWSLEKMRKLEDLKIQVLAQNPELLTQHPGLLKEEQIPEENEYLGCSKKKKV